MLLDGDKKSSGNQSKYDWDGFESRQTLDGIELDLDSGRWTLDTGSRSKLLKQISHKLQIVRRRVAGKLVRAWVNSHEN